MGEQGAEGLALQRHHIFFSDQRACIHVTTTHHMGNQRCNVEVVRADEPAIAHVDQRALDRGNTVATSHCKRALVRRAVAVAGRNGIATIKGSLVNMRDGGFISAHDFHIASLIAHVVCGGDVDAGTLVTEEYLMTLERQAFCALLTHPKTQERIMGMMATGKPLRN